MGIFEEIFEFRTLKGHEAQGQFRGEILILDYASTLLRSLLRRNCTEVGLSGLCDPLAYKWGFLRKFLNFEH